MLERAELLLVQRCMRARGIPYSVAAPVPDSWQRSFPYVVDEADWARRYGYGAPLQRRLQALKEADPNQRYFTRLSADGRATARSALMGPAPVGLSATTPTGVTITASTQGCLAHAQRALYGDLGAWFRAKVITMNLQPLYVAQVRADPRYAAAVRQWSACMRTQGHPYATPAASRKAAVTSTRRLPVAQADARQARIAVAEAHCATTTSLSRTVRDLDRHYSDQVRVRYRKEITVRHTLQHAALATARRLVTEAGQ
ncbi:hypothetical protein CP973_22745 [Streptomyces albofaciens JCM 4342]|nr:hypothetical protein CP973_22745 [Streptomyces albofaciens JCM 4342]